MMRNELIGQAIHHLNELCTRFPDRAVGNAGNQHASRYFSEYIRQTGLTYKQLTFDCLDWEEGPAYLYYQSRKIPLQASPYSLGCDCEAILVEASTLAELRELDADKRILLLHGELSAEPMMPKHYPFYNPDSHRQLVSLLEEKHPLAIIAATQKTPEMMGAVDPPPMFEDGDFGIPAVHTDQLTGAILKECAWDKVHLISQGRRIPATGEQIVVSCGDHNASDCILVCCHIDSKKGSPGALDNAGGTVVLLLLAQLLADNHGPRHIELVPFNGEDYWAASGELAYLQHCRALPGLCVNLDGVGDISAPNAASFYNCPPDIETIIRKECIESGAAVEGESWVAGDHSIFTMQGVPAVAFTTADMTQRWCTIAHTPADTVELIDPEKLVDLALAIHRGIRAL